MEQGEVRIWKKLEIINYRDEKKRKYKKTHSHETRVQGRAVRVSEYTWLLPPSRWALPATVLHVTIMVAAGDVIPALVWLFCSVYYEHDNGVRMRGARNSTGTRNTEILLKHQQL